MTSISESQSNILAYSDMKDSVNAIYTYLSTNKDICDKLSLKIDQNYELDNNSTIVNDRLKKLNSDVDKTSNYLKYTIIPAIDAAIKSERDNIEAIERAIREEEARRKAQEEAAKAAAAQSSTSSSPSTTTSTTIERHCSNCGNLISSKRCPFCGVVEIA